MLEGSNFSRFQLNLKHKPSDMMSTFFYHAWWHFATAWSRFEINYSEQFFFFDLYTFSSSLMNVTFERDTNYSSNVERLKTWDEKSSTYFFTVSWEFEDASIDNIKISTKHWLLINREKFQIWTKFQKSDAKLTIAVVGECRFEKDWSFFVNQSFSILPLWWRYAEPTHSNQHVVRELPFMQEGSELFQYHQKIKEDKLQVVSMTTHLIYQTPIDYEVYAIGSLMKGVEYAKKTYKNAFNSRYNFSFDFVGVVNPRKRGWDTFFIRLQLEPWMFRDDGLPSVPEIGTMSKHKGKVIFSSDGWYLCEHTLSLWKSREWEIQLHWSWRNSVVFFSIWKPCLKIRNRKTSDQRTHVGKDGNFPG